VYSALGADFSALMRYINSRFTHLLTDNQYVKINKHLFVKLFAQLAKWCLH